jgi:ubiquinol-cytochrome c reductase cytochrome b subunit
MANSAPLSTEKLPPTTTGGRALAWIDERFPLSVLWNSQVAEYYAPKNFNFWYYFGSLALLILVNQIVTGIFLTMYYKPDAGLAFASVEGTIMREVSWGWLIRLMHSTGASFFFIVVYLHMFRALLYGSYRNPRELTWIFGVLIFLCLMAEAFFGYLLPWGQMSYWGAQVIVNLFSAIPVVGEELSIWIRGDYVVSDATLNRFFALHVIAIPLVLLGLVVAHLMALHETGSNNPEGIEVDKSKIDPKTGWPEHTVPFHPHYTVKDAFGTAVFLLVFSLVLFFAPEMKGYFLEYNNFIPADSLKTPSHIAPVWYFTPFYSILRATTENIMPYLAGFVALIAVLSFLRAKTKCCKIAAVVIGLVLIYGMVGNLIGIGVGKLIGQPMEWVYLEAKVWGVILMGVSVLIFFLMPWLDQSPVKSIRYKGGLFKIALTLFVIVFLVLGYYGTQPVTDLGTRVSQICTMLYFAFFFLMPWYSRMDKVKPVPARVTH